MNKSQSTQATMKKLKDANKLLCQHAKALEERITDLTGDCEAYGEQLEYLLGKLGFFLYLLHETHDILESEDRDLSEITPQIDEALNPTEK